MGGDRAVDGSEGQRSAGAFGLPATLLTGGCRMTVIRSVSERQHLCGPLPAGAPAARRPSIEVNQRMKATRDDTDGHFVHACARRSSGALRPGRSYLVRFHRCPHLLAGTQTSPGIPITSDTVTCGQRRPATPTGLGSFCGRGGGVGFILGERARWVMTAHPGPGDPCPHARADRAAPLSDRCPRASHRADRRRLRAFRARVRGGRGHARPRPARSSPAPRAAPLRLLTRKQPHIGQSVLTTTTAPIVILGE